MGLPTAFKEIFKSVQSRVPLGLWRRLMPRTRIIINYHLVSDQDLPHMRWLLPRKTAQQFARDVEYLCNNYSLMVEEEPESRRSTSTPPCSITFDDGLAECYSVVRPILRQYKVRAFFFVITDCIDNRAMMYRHKASLCIDRISLAPAKDRARLLAASSSVLGTRFVDLTSFKLHVLGLSAAQTALIDELCEQLGVNVSGYLAKHVPYLSRDQIRELDEDGHIIGGHSIDHPELRTLSPEEIRRQIVGSCANVAQLIGSQRVPFSAPFYLDGVDRSLLRHIVRDHPVVSQIFGSAGVEREPHGILNRVGGDDPRGAGEDCTNLPLLLRDAYMFAARRNLIRQTRWLLPRAASNRGSLFG